MRAVFTVLLDGVVHTPPVYVKYFMCKNLNRNTKRCDLENYTNRFVCFIQRYSNTFYSVGACYLYSVKHIQLFLCNLRKVADGFH